MSFLTIAKSNVFFSLKTHYCNCSNSLQNDIYFLYYTHLLTASFSQKYFCNTSQIRQQYVKSKRNKYFIFYIFDSGPVPSDKSEEVQKFRGQGSTYSSVNRPKPLGIRPSYFKAKSFGLSLSFCFYSQNAFVLYFVRYCFLVWYSPETISKQVIILICS